MTNLVLLFILLFWLVLAKGSNKFEAAAALLARKSQVSWFEWYIFYMPGCHRIFCCISYRLRSMMPLHTTVENLIPFNFLNYVNHLIWKGKTILMEIFFNYILAQPAPLSRMTLPYFAPLDSNPDLNFGGWSAVQLRSQRITLWIIFLQRQL